MAVINFGIAARIEWNGDAGSGGASRGTTGKIISLCSDFGNLLMLM